MSPKKLVPPSTSVLGVHKAALQLLLPMLFLLFPSSCQPLPLPSIRLFPCSLFWPLVINLLHHPTVCTRPIIFIF